MEKVDEQGLVDFARQLVQIPSYTGQEQEAAQYMVEEMERLGFDRAWVDGVGNAIGEIKGSAPGPKVLFAGHMDTVPVSGSERWTVDPFDGEIREGCLYGRGACGMKGALASMVYGLAPLVHSKDRLAGSVYVAATVASEQFEGLAFVQVVQTLKPQFVIIGKPSGLDIKTGQRGRTELSITTKGKAAHSAHGEAGQNAVEQMLTVLGALRNIPLPEQPGFGKASLEMTNLISAPYPGTSTIPHKCWATFDRYLLPGEKEEEVLAPFYKIIEDLKSKDNTFAADIEIVEAGLECYTGQYISTKRFFVGWQLEESHALVQGAIRAVEQTGLVPRLSVYPFCTDGSYSAVTAGLPTIGFGPGDETGVHRADEHVQLQQLFAAAAAYQAMACQLLQK